MVNESDDMDFADDGEAANDEVLKSAFPRRKGPVDVVSWKETEEIGYRLYFGRLSSKWGIASWGLITLNRGAIVGQVTYDDRPRVFKREGLTDWLIASGVNVYEAPQLADLAVDARGDLFRDASSGGLESESELAPRWTDRMDVADDEPA